MRDFLLKCSSSDVDVVAAVDVILEDATVGFSIVFELVGGASFGKVDFSSSDFKCTNKNTLTFSLQEQIKIGRAHV